MQARIQRIATEAEVKASSIRSHKDAQGFIFVGGVIVRGVSIEGEHLPLDDHKRYYVNEIWLQTCSPRRFALARYHGLFDNELGVLTALATDGWIDAIDNIFNISNVGLHLTATRGWFRDISKQAYFDELQRAAQDAEPVEIDPPLKPLGEWIPPKTTLWQKIRVWIQAVVNDHDLLMEIGKLKMMLDQRYIEKSKAERAFISVARPRYMNNSLPPNDRMLYEALCDFHGEEKLDEVPF